MKKPFFGMSTITGPFGLLDIKRKEIKSILKSSNVEKVLQPWFKRLSKEKDFEIVKSEEIVKTTT